MKCLLVLLLAFGAVPAIAQVPSGMFNYAFTNTPLWDASGIYTNVAATNGVTDTTIVQTEHAANGAVTGSRSQRIVADEDDYVDLDGPITGKVSAKNGVATTSLKESGSANGVNEGVAFTGTFTGKSTETIDAELLMIVADGTERICPKGAKCIAETGSESYSLLPGMTGDWTLDNDIAADGTKLSGTGTLTLSNARALTYMIVGSYNTKTAAAKLRLVGQGDAVGTSLSLTTQGTNMDLTALKGKVLGQQPVFPVAPR